MGRYMDEWMKQADLLFSCLVHKISGEYCWKMMKRPATQERQEDSHNGRWLVDPDNDLMHEYRLKLAWIGLLTRTYVVFHWHELY